MNTSFGLIGAGWRSEFFLRIARDLPERFPLAGIVVRDPVKAERCRASWPGVAIFGSWQELVEQTAPGFLVTSVGWAANPPLVTELAELGIAVLSETPIAPGLEDMVRLYELSRRSGVRIQVAEQYLFQSLHAARLALVNSGRLGRVFEADVSIAHGYHGISLLRRYLGVGMELPSRIAARNFTSRIVAGPGRDGPPEAEELRDSTRTIAQLEFAGKLGVFDFVGDQYFSWIRSPRLLVRGERGEINNSTVRLLRDFRTPEQYDLTRRDAGQDGNLEGLFHQSIQGGGEILYTNPFPYARWSDDEIAVATCLARMQDYVQGGEEFYSVAEACQDRYLDLLIAQAAENGKAIVPEPQAWSAA